jgi:glutamate N-acetyltransferase / amino-acid N-acetyltransferase
VRWPKGFSSAGVSCGIKQQGRDLGLLACEHPAGWAGTFTMNAAAAAPVMWCRSKLGSPVRAIVVNSGNANACTGVAGRAAVEEEAKVAGAALGASSEDVLVASTGPIGVRLPIDKLVAATPELVRNLTGEVNEFAESILTTDTATKLAVSNLGDASIVGVAKGAAMLAPNMATMLAFIATDANFPELQAALQDAVDHSFNRISVDACESTNDSVFLIASGEAGAVDEDKFLTGLRDVCSELAEQIVRDAEGGTRTVRIHVRGAGSDDQAADLARAVAASALWRAAVHGSDPNWGRIASALGATDRSLDPAGLAITIGSEPVFDHGEPAASLERAAKEMEADDITVGCVVGSGPGEAIVLTADLSPEYVELNAVGTS